MEDEPQYNMFELLIHSKDVAELKKMREQFQDVSNTVINCISRIDQTIKDLEVHKNGGSKKDMENPNLHKSQCYPAY